MTHLIESTFDLRNQLGNDISSIKKLDPLPRQRKRTSSEKIKLQKEFGRICAYCSRRGYVEAAHIIPLEIGGDSSPENLILLCKRCHQNFDSGCLSISKMQTYSYQWRNRTSNEANRPFMIDHVEIASAMTAPPKSVIPVLKEARKKESLRWYKSATNLIQDALLNMKLDEIERNYLIIKMAEITRRRSGRGVLKHALEVLHSVDQTVLPLKYLPVYYYELGYVHRLNGNHSEAAAIYERSAHICKEINRSKGSLLGFIAASVNAILCTISTRKSLTEIEREGYLNQLSDLEGLSRTLGDYWGGRWTRNCAQHKLQIQLKIGNAEECWKTLQRLRDIYFMMDQKNGWDAAGKISMSLMEGLTRTLYPRNEQELREGIELLARSFFARLGPRQRPEGIRDVVFGLLKGIGRSDVRVKNSTLYSLKSLMSQTLDGTSVLWPYRQHQGNFI